MRFWLAALVVASACAALPAASPAAAAARDEVAATFMQFVAAQNAHDLEALSGLLSDSPNFLWITRDGVVRGRDDALRRFARLFQGTWHADPDPSTLEVTMLDVSTAQVSVQIVIADGASVPWTPPRPTLMNQIMVRTPEGWRILSILPVTIQPRSPVVRTMGNIGVSPTSSSSPAHDRWSPRPRARHNWSPARQRPEMRAHSRGATRCCAGACCARGPTT